MVNSIGTLGKSCFMISQDCLNERFQTPPIFVLKAAGFVSKHGKLFFKGGGLHFQTPRAFFKHHAACFPTRRFAAKAAEFIFNQPRDVRSRPNCELKKKSSPHPHCPRWLASNFALRGALGCNLCLVSCTDCNRHAPYLKAKKR